MRSYKKALSGIVAGICAIGMAACGGSSSSGDVTDLQYKDIQLGTTGKDITTTIKLYSHRTDMMKDDYNGTTWKEYIAEFNKTYPNITVKVEAGTDYGNSALTRLQGGDWGDMMMIPTVDASELGNYFLPYGDVKDMGKLVHYEYAQQYGGKVYGVSSTGNAVGIVYNKAVFNQAGIDSLPTTPKEFITDLSAVKDKTDAIPMYTNYAAGWTMGAWDAYVGGTATGDKQYMNQKLLHTKDPFSDPGDGTHMYNVYKILYDSVAKGLTEDDYSTTDWEGSKTQMNDGKIATMVLGSWAVSQMKAAGDNADDIDYMPFPITIDGKQYTSSAADYAFGINKDTSVDNQKASMIFVKWMTDKSNFSYNEGGLPVSRSDDRLPDLYKQFDDVTFLEDEPSVEGEEDLFNDINSDSELAINAGGDARVQAIVEHASNQDESYDDMVQEWNGKWNQALEDEGVDIKYTTVTK